METAIEQKLIGGKSFFLFDFHIDLFGSNIYTYIFIINKNIYAAFCFYIIHRLSSWNSFQFAAIKLIA